MNKILLMLVVLGCLSCTQNSEDIVDNSLLSDAEILSSEYNNVQLQFSNPIVLDSVNWILYPLDFDGLKNSSKNLKRSYNKQNAYWNVAFYNNLNNQTHLLSDSLKMLIKSINPKNELIQSSGQKENYVFYTIATKDYNQDKELNFEDPNYLFYSDVSGQNFTQISPNNHDLISWYLIDDAKTILLQVRKDSNQDKVFDGDDDETSFIFNIQTEELKQVFNNDFNLRVKKVYNAQWLDKD